MTDQDDPRRTRTYSWDDPRETAGALAGRSGREFLDGIRSGEIPAPPIARTLDFDLVEVGDGTATFAVTPQELHYNPIGSVHGGLAATLLDSALGCALQTRLPEGVGYTTVELKVNMVRAISAGVGELRCTATLVHQGSRIATTEGRVTDADGKLYAHGSATLMILRHD